MPGVCPGEGQGIYTVDSLDMLCIVDYYCKALGKRNLTFLVPEIKSDEDKNRVNPFKGTCLDTLYCCDKDTYNTTASSIIPVTVAYYLYDILQQKAEVCKASVYCAYTDEWSRKQPHTCIDTLPFFYIKGH